MLCSTLTRWSLLSRLYFRDERLWEPSAKCRLLSAPQPQLSIRTASLLFLYTSFPSNVMLISLFRLHAAFSLLLAVAHASVAQPRDRPPVTVPLRRRSDKQRRTTPEDFAAMAQSLRNKYNLSPGTLSRRQGSGTVAITDLSFDSSYSGSIAIGSPGAGSIGLSCLSLTSSCLAQTFNVILDTGSSDLWVASSACATGCGQGTPKYNSGSSSSFSNQKQAVSITYGSGAVAGQLGTDTVSMGGFTVQAQPFGKSLQLVPRSS